MENKFYNEKTLVELLLNRSHTLGDAKAFTFLNDDGTQDVISYAELDRRAKVIAARLLEKKLSKERALLLYPPGLDYICGYFGCLYAGVIAVPVYPPDPPRLKKTLPRLQSIIKDSKAKIALTTKDVLEQVEEWKNDSQLSEILSVEDEFSLGSIEWLATDIYDENLGSLALPDMHSNDIAYLQYTSGSTGSPKGVIITHENLLYNSVMIKDGFGLYKEHEGVIWLPIYHDMGLIGGILQPLFSGFHTTLMSPVYFLKRPLRWLQIISDIKDKAVVSGGPNFAYDLCIKSATPSKVEKLDLSNWEVAFSGAEPVRAVTIDEFSNTFAPAGFKKSAFYPCYGLAEATLIVSGVNREEIPKECKLNKYALRQNKIEIEDNDADAQKFIGCGTKLLEEEIAIVNPDTLEKLSENEIGEIWVKGKNVAKGYWENKQVTNEIFNAYTSNTNEGPFLRTGDLGFLLEGELYVTGRLKDMIIIDGTNHYPQDIELTVERANKLLRPSSGAVFSVEVDNKERLVVVHEARAKKNVDWQSVIKDIISAVSENHNIQTYAVVLIQPKTIFKTSSGKIQRRATKKAYLNNELEVIAEWKLGDSIITEKKEKPESLIGTSGVSTKDRKAIESWLISKLAETLSVSKNSIDPDEPFANFGIDSTKAVKLVGDLENQFDVELSPTLLWEYPTIKKLSGYLMNLHDEKGTEEENKIKGTVKEKEPVAIIGIGLRFPEAETKEEFWNMLAEGKSGIIDIPKERWDVEKYYDSTGTQPGKMITKKGGFLKNFDMFDPHFFGISPRESVKIDPQQRVVLETVWEALEDAAINPDEIAGSKTGVFLGISNMDYTSFQRGFPQNLDAYSGTGNAFSVAANRVSYTLDLQGPSVALDTACSSSLVSVHLACKSLQNGESDMAIAGGVNMILTPDINIAFSQAKMLSPTGSCKTFDANADGYIRSEGCGIIVLKRLSDAIKDNDNIIAVIKGSAVNQDGKSNGITAPNKQAQVKVIRKALDDAGMSHDEIDYVEAHGTGTILGDPIEVQGLAEVFEKRTKGNPLFIGSVKTNIGHTESAAGIAGIIKTALSLQHATIPKHINFKKINPHIPIDKLPFNIPTETTPWEVNGKKRTAGVSSYGFGGTNAHIILQEAPVKIKKENKVDRTAHLFTLSGYNSGALKDLADKYADYLNNDDTESIGDICYTVNTGRKHFGTRLAAVVSSTTALKESLRNFTNGAPDPNVKISGENLNGKTVFLFTGQGAQYFEMGKVLYETHPAFKKTIDLCNGILSEKFDINLTELLYSSDRKPEEIHQTKYTQPALFAIEYAVAKLWESWGITPEAVIGHSIGEITAACYSGVISLEDALKIVAVRGKLMQSLPQNGIMAVVFSNVEEVSELISEFGEKVSIAGINGPANTVISGQTELVEKVLEKAKNKNIKIVKIKTSHAFHSALMDPILDEFNNSISDVKFNRPNIPIISNITGKFIGEEEIQDSNYWTKHIRSAVNYYDGIKSLVDSGFKIFIEVGPHPSLLSMARAAFPDYEALWLPSLKKENDDWSTILSSVAELYVNGLNIDWKKFESDYNRNKLNLPTYAFQRSRYWVDTSAKKNFPGKNNGTALLQENVINPLLHRKVTSPIIKQHIYETIVSLDNLKWLEDHKIFNVPVFPATAYLITVYSAAENAFGKQMFSFRDISLTNILPVMPQNKIKLQIVLEELKGSETEFKVFTTSIQNNGVEQEWILNVTGKLNTKLNNIVENVYDNNGIEFKPDEFKKESFYKSLSDNGLNYGEAFRGIQNIKSNNNEVIAEIQIAEDILNDLSDYPVHPAILDSALQSSAAIIGNGNNKLINDSVYLPVGVDEFWLTDKAVGKLFSKSKLIDKSENGFTFDVILIDENKKQIGFLKGFKILKIQRENLPVQFKINLSDWLYNVEWIEAESNQTGNENSENEHSVILFSVNRNSKTKELIEKLKDAKFNVTTAFAGNGFEEINGNEFHVDLSSSENVGVFLAKVLHESDSKPLDIIVDTTNSDFSDSLASAELLKIENNLAGKLLNILKGLITGGITNPLKLMIITDNAVKVNDNEDVNPLATSVWGFGQVLMLEHPEFNSVLIDLDENSLDAFVRDFPLNENEDRVAYRQGEKFTAKLRKAEFEEAGEDLENQSSGNMRLEIKDKGVLDNIKFVPVERPAPRNDELEIKVMAAGLNFRDVMNALNLYPGDAGNLGGECSGIVTRIGNNVTNYKPGDKVFGIAPGSFSKYVVTKSALVHKLPDNLEFEDAATVPITFLTAYHALIKLANIKEGDKVLIHAASGGVGQAAIQLCKMVGAEIFATAGSDEKRNFLRELGLKHIMNSRTTEFAEEIKKITNGAGVDVILNSLSGEFIEKGLSVLNKNGTFLEIGKVNIWTHEEVNKFRPDVKYHIIALDDMSENQPLVVRELLEELVPLFEQKQLTPLTKKVYPVSEAISAFRFMAQTKHIGKIVIRVNQSGAGTEKEPVTIERDGIYVISGGFGALGQIVMDWLTYRGAGNIVLIGRSEPNQPVKDKLKELTGVSIYQFFGDVSDETSVEKLKNLLKEINKPVRGIIHAAGVLDDGIIMQQSGEKFAKVLSPKIGGAVNLLNAVDKKELDFVLFFSSVASLLGSAGQSNYAVANAFLDGFAKHLKQNGINAISINWGPWESLGMTANLAGGNKNNLGFISVTPDVGIRLLDVILNNDYDQIGAFKIDWKKLINTLGEENIKSFISDFAEFEGESEEKEVPQLVIELSSMEPENRKEKVVDFLKSQTIRVLGLDPEFPLDTSKNLNEMGLDSLMAIELKNTIDKAIGKKLPATLVFNYPSIDAIGEHLVSDILKFEDKPDEIETGEIVEDESLDDVIDELENMSDEEVEALLLKKLDEQNNEE